MQITQSMREEMFDPLTNNPFQNAQQINCGEGTLYSNHSLDLISINNIFRNNSGICPRCHRTFTQYQPNKPLQNLINAVLGLDKGEAHITTLNGMMNTNNHDPYPLAASEFNYERGSNTPRYKVIGFRNSSDRKDSIHVFYLMWDEGTHKLSFYCYNYENFQQLREAFVNQGVRIGLQTVHVTEKPDNSTFCFEIFPGEKFKNCIDYIVRHNRFNANASVQLSEYLYMIKE